MLTLERTDLKKRVVLCPEVLSVIRGEQLIYDYLHSFYECDYKTFFGCLVQIDSVIRSEQYLAAHADYYVREMRIKAYNQFLASYKSVTMESMAATFGVSSEFIDRELSRFIASNRITAKIDKTAGIIESNRPDQKNASYNSVIKHGDQILNRIQKLARLTSTA